jgi:hypothetical protein
VTCMPLDISDWILLATLIAIIWYTVETYKLRKATILATRLEFQPLLIVNQQAGSRDLYVSNVGRGHAFNVECRYILKDGEVPERGHCHLLKVGDTIRLNTLFLDENKEMTQYGKLLEAQFDDRVAKPEATLLIEFSDIQNTRYRQRFSSQAGNRVALTEILLINR